MSQPIRHPAELARYGSAAQGGAHAARARAAGAAAAAPEIALVPSSALPIQEHFGRRILNVAVAGLGVVVAAPIMLVVAALVKFTSRGPVIYTQTRIGLDQRRPGPGADNHRRTKNIGGKPFRIYKFRTMKVDAEAGTGAVWATPADPRLTPIGGFLRQYRLDEIPQLFNVLKGDMNIVGPRPERPQLFDSLCADIEHYPLRQRGKPGITGLAQISQQYDGCLDDVRRKVQYDLLYLRRRTLAHDIWIMLRTVPVVLFRRGGW